MKGREGRDTGRAFGGVNVASRARNDPAQLLPRLILHEMSSQPLQTSHTSFPSGSDRDRGVCHWAFARAVPLASPPRSCFPRLGNSFRRFLNCHFIGTDSPEPPLARWSSSKALITLVIYILWL